MHFLQTNLIVLVSLLVLLGCENEQKTQIRDRFLSPGRFESLTLSSFDLLFENGTSFSVTNQNELDQLYQELCNPNLPFLAANEKGKWFYMDYRCSFSDGVAASYSAALKFNQKGTYLRVYFQEDEAFMGDPDIYIQLDGVISDANLLSLKRLFGQSKATEHLGTPTNKNKVSSTFNRFGTAKTEIKSPE